MENPPFSSGIFLWRPPFSSVPFPRLIEWYWGYMSHLIPCISTHVEWLRRTKTALHDLPSHFLFERTESGRGSLRLLFLLLPWPWPKPKRSSLVGHGNYWEATGYYPWYATSKTDRHWQTVFNFTCQNRETLLWIILLWYFWGWNIGASWRYCWSAMIGWWQMPPGLLGITSTNPQ